MDYARINFPIYQTPVPPALGESQKVIMSTLIKSDFNMCPDEGPPRIIRFAHLPIGDVAQLDKAQNVLLVDPTVYLRLEELDQKRLFHTGAELVKEIRVSDQRSTFKDT